MGKGNLQFGSIACYGTPVILEIGIDTQKFDTPSFEFALELIESRNLITNDLAAQAVRKTTARL